MRAGARRQRSRPGLNKARRALIPVALWLAVSAGTTGAFAASACADGDGHWIRRVCYTDRGSPPGYGHHIFGNLPEWTELTVFHGPAARAASDGHRGAGTITFRPGFFEDIAPRLADLDGDGRPEILVVHTDADRGARLAVIGVAPGLELVAATPFIGQRHRWLAPVGAADLDGDGAVEIAYVDRPHLAKTLRLWRFSNGALSEVASLPGVSNHGIGDQLIHGGIRDCGPGPEIVVASGDRSRLLAVTFDGRRLASRDLAPYSAAAESAALGCALF